MLKTVFSLAAAFALLPLTSAQADNWALIDMVETPGDRSIYYALYDKVKRYSDPSLAGLAAPETSGQDRSGLPPLPFENSDVVEVEVVQVFEAAGKPRVSNYRVVADCLRGRMKISTVDSLFRDGSAAMDQAGTDWFDTPTSTWLSRVSVIACDTAAMDTAKRAAARQRSYDPFMELGLLHVGEFTGTYPLIELTRSAFWTDATEPPIRQLSGAEERALRQEVAERLSALQAEVAGYTAMAEASLSSQTEERRFMTGVAATFAEKPRPQRVLFGAMAGWTEAEVVDFWGRPDRIRQGGDAQAFDYESTVDTRQLIVEQWAIAGEVAYEVGELQHCDLTFWMRPGGSKPGLRLVDVELVGDNCKRSTLRQIRP